MSAGDEEKPNVKGEGGDEHFNIKVKMGECMSRARHSEALLCVCQVLYIEHCWLLGEGQLRGIRSHVVPKFVD